MHLLTVSSVCLDLFSKSATDSGKVSGQQRAKEPEAALGGRPQASLQPGVPGSDQHPAARPGDAPERDHPLHAHPARAAQAVSPRPVHGGEEGQDG